jgi:hypothetical protein
MSISPRKNRRAFRPTLEGLYLEERVVLNGASAVGAAMAAQVSTPQTGGVAPGGQTGLANPTTGQIRNASGQQLLATAPRPSAQASLLPASSQLVSNPQTSAPGNQNPSPQLQSVSFTGQPSASFAGGMSGLFPTGAGTSPFTPATFNTNIQSAFLPGFQNLATPLNQFFVVPMTTGTGGASQSTTGFFQTGTTFPSVFGIPSTGSGFNNGSLTTGSGFPGFGTAPVGFNTNFATGFNTFMSGVNQEFGIIPPNLGVGTAIGLVTGTGLGTGLGTGPGTTFLLGSAITPM